MPRFTVKIRVALVATMVFTVSLARAEPVAESSVRTQPAVVDLHPRALGTARSSAERSTASDPTNPPSQIASPSTVSGGSGGAGALSNPIVRTGVALSGVLLLIVVLATIARALARKNGTLASALGASRAPSGIIEILGRYPLARGQTLLLLKLDRRILLVGQTHSRLRGGQGSLATLADISDAEDVASILLRAQDDESARTAARFKSLLDRFDRDHNPGIEEVEPAPRRGLREKLRFSRTSDASDRVELWNDGPSGLRLADVEPNHPNFDHHPAEAAVEGRRAPLPRGRT